jgi:TonB family protein
MIDPALLIVELALKSTLVLGAVWLVIGTVRRLSASERHALWAFALIGLLMLPPITRLGPAVELPVPTIGAAPEGQVSFLQQADPQAVPIDQLSTATVPETADGSAAGAEHIANPAAGTTREGSVTGSSGWRVEASVAVTAVYLAGAFALLASLAIAVIRVSFAVRRLAPLREPRTLALLEHLRTGVGLRRRIRLLRSCTDATPWVWGLLRPVIVVPESFASWPRAAQRNALLHELAHIARLDYLTTLLGYVCRALYWFQPLVWLSAARMHREAERACDDRVLITSPSRTVYASQLLDIAATMHRGERERVASCAMASPTGLSERVRSILDANRRRTAMGYAKSAFVLTITATLVLGIGMLKTSTDTQAQQTPEPAAPVAGPADLRTIAARGPQDSEELELLVMNYLTEGRDAEAVQVLAEYVWPYGYGSRRDMEPADRSDPDCAFCRKLLETDAALTDWTRGSHAALPALLAAFDLIEQQAYEGLDGNALVALAGVTRGTGIGLLARGGLAQWYLLEGFRLGDLTDRSKLRAVTVLADVHWYEQGKALAEHLYNDASSSLYQSVAVQQWIRYLDASVQRVNDGGARLLAAGTGGTGPDGEFLPLVRVAPRYPTDAVTERREGYAIVEFTVDQRGRTANLQAVESSDSTFEQPSIDAARQFRYAPRIVDGTPVEVPGVRNVFTFRLE